MASGEFPILITGVTGKQGGAIAGNLIGKGHKNIRVMTRNPSKAKVYKEAGAQVVEGNLKDRASMEKALQGVKKLFLMGTPYEQGPEEEVEQGITSIDAAKAAGVQHIVYSSVASAHRNTGIPHFESKWQIEHHLVASGIPYTIIRPVWFMENLESPWHLPALKSGKFIYPMPPDRPLQMVAVQDVGEFVAAALTRPDEFIGRQFDIAGEEMPVAEAVRIIGELAGKKIEFQYVPPEVALPTIGEDLAKMYDWFNRVGYDVDIPALKQQWDIPLTSFRDWIGLSSLTKEL